MPEFTRIMSLYEPSGEDLLHYPFVMQRSLTSLDYLRIFHGLNQVPCISIQLACYKFCLNIKEQNFILWFTSTYVHLRFRAYLSYNFMVNP